MCQGDVAKPGPRSRGSCEMSPESHNGEQESIQAGSNMLIYDTLMMIDRIVRNRVTGQSMLTSRGLAA